MLTSLVLFVLVAITKFICPLANSLDTIYCITRLLICPPLWRRPAKKKGFPPNPAPPPLTCDVIDYHGDSGVTDVAGNETPETLLPGRVPQLQTHLHKPTNIPEIQQEDKKEERGGRGSSKRGPERTSGRREARGGGRRKGRERTSGLRGTYLWCRTLRQRRPSRGCSWGSGYGIAPGLPCPTAATWSVCDGRDKSRGKKKQKKKKKKIKERKKRTSKTKYIMQNKYDGQTDGAKRISDAFNKQEIKDSLDKWTERD